MTDRSQKKEHSEVELHNISLLKKFFDEVFNQRQTETIHEILTDDSIIRYEHNETRGPVEWEEQFYDILIRAIPDLRVDIAEIAADGTTVMIRWVAKGIFRKNLFGVHPTGKKFEFSGLSWVKLRDGNVDECWNNWNMSFLFRQLYTEVKVLRGILPVCSFCKKVRDEDGYWEQVDVYIRKYSEADISHGICPECMKKNYPEEYAAVYLTKAKNGRTKRST